MRKIKLLLTQIESSDPVCIELKNTLTGTPVLYTAGLGDIRVVLEGAFLEGKCFGYMPTFRHLEQDVLVIPDVKRMDNDTMSIRLKDILDRDIDIGADPVVLIIETE